MSTLIEFMQSQSQKGKDVALMKGASEIALSRSIEASLVLSPALTNHSEEAKFSHEVAEIVSGEEFISELSTKIGKPRSGESEDEFVDRAKNSLRDLLQRKVLKAS